MARMKGGLHGPIIGRVGNTVGYLRLGEPIVRIITPPNKHRKKSEKQKAAFDRLRVIMEFVSPINRFVNTSFKLTVQGSTKIPQNAAVSLNINTAIKGEYPNLELDYPNLVISKGHLLPPKNVTVSHTITPNNTNTAQIIIKFQWDVENDWDYPTKRSEVMMLAFRPDNKRKPIFCITGNRRQQGEDILQGIVCLKNHSGMEKDRYIETYIAFISDDRESISDSIYAGRIVL